MKLILVGQSHLSQWFLLFILFILFVYPNKLCQLYTFVFVRKKSEGETTGRPGGLSEETQLAGDLVDQLLLTEDAEDSTRPRGDLGVAGVLDEICEETLCFAF